MTTRRITSSSITSGGGGATVRYQPDQPIGVTPGELWVDSDGDTDVVDAETFLTKESASASYVYKSGDTITGPTVITTNSSSDALRITQTGSGDALVVEDSTNPDSTSFVINTDGNVGIGIDPGVNKFQIFDSTSSRVRVSGNSTVLFTMSSSIDAPTIAPFLVFSKTRGTDQSPTNVLQDDALGVIRFSGHAGLSSVNAAEIKSEVDGTPGVNDMPGRLIFSTSADGSGIPTERMRITSSGNVGIGTSSPSAKVDVAAAGAVTSAPNAVANNLVLRGLAAAGMTILGNSTSESNIFFGDTDSQTIGRIQYLHNVDALRFIVNSAEPMRINNAGAVLIGTTSPGSASTGDLVVNGGVFLGGSAAANELDDYEEGTFTPTFQSEIDSSGFTAGYTKIGNLVFYYLGGRIRRNAASATGFSIGGLPFSTGFSSAGIVMRFEPTGWAYQVISVTSSGTSLTFFRPSDSTNMLVGTTNNNDGAVLQIDDISDTTNSNLQGIVLNGWYRV